MPSYSTVGFKWIDSKDCGLNKYTCISSKGFVSEVDLEYAKESRQLHNYYPLVTSKIEMKEKMLSKY